ncbi:MAG: hypothetical protein NDI77_10760 [Geobacteraceae bacterium]|nr:hypothetical protein [Geobacteraceae bacterium]
MPTIDITRPELIWPGKYDENGSRVESRGTALPFQVQTTLNGDVHWILETKGREFEDTTSKDFHMARWCEDVSRESGETWRYLKVRQTVFDDFIRRGDYRRFEALVDWNTSRHGLFQ